MIDLPDVLGWVAGVDWPEGDEDKMFALAEGWFQASDQLKSTIQQLDAAKSMMQHAYPAGEGSASILANYDNVRNYLDDLVGRYHQIGDAAKDTGADIEAAKIEMMIALVILAAELVYALTAGPAAPALQAGLIGITRVIIRVFSGQLLTALARNSAKAMASRAVKDLAKHAGLQLSEAIGKQGLKRVGVEALKEAGEEIREELFQTYATKAYQVTVGHRDSSELTDWNNRDNLRELGLTVAGAAAGGATASLAGKGFAKLPGVDLGAKGMRGAITGLAAGTTAGAAGGYAAAAVPAIYQNGWNPDNWNIDPRAITGGAASGGLPGAVRGQRGLAQTHEVDNLDLYQRGDGSLASSTHRTQDTVGPQEVTQSPDQNGGHTSQRSVASGNPGASAGSAYSSLTGESSTAPDATSTPVPSEPATGGVEHANTNAAAEHTATRATPESTTLASSDTQHSGSENPGAPDAESGSRSDFGANHRDGITEVTDTRVPGSDRYIEPDLPTTTDHIHALHNRIAETLDQVVTGYGGLSIEHLDHNHYRITDNHHTFDVHFDTRTLNEHTAAQSVLNHDTNQHTVYLNERLRPEEIQRSLAHEIGEIVENQRRNTFGQHTHRPDTDIMRPGTTPPTATPTPHDIGRIQELRVLAEHLTAIPPQTRQTDPTTRAEYNHIHREATALIEHLGLRQNTPGATQRRAIITQQLTPHARKQVDHLLTDAARPETELSPPEQQLLDNIRSMARAIPPNHSTNPPPHQTQITTNPHPNNPTPHQPP
ncbi:hypothetical protein AB0C34_31490, partial [Nocardia sp. NPDC049220]|uniref:WXG100-like domain-containing protein n=1 Tax=Nocardia sp. NPDC049220 TaxID=3155273 RepID=UPI0033E1FC85